MSIKTQPDFPARTPGGNTLGGQESASNGSRNVGRFSQGSIKTMPARGPDLGQGDTVPTRSAPAGPVPANQVPTRDNGNTVGNNDGHKV